MWRMGEGGANGNFNTEYAEIKEGRFSGLILLLLRNLG
jgi:hypothetical protein